MYFFKNSIRSYSRLMFFLIFSVLVGFAFFHGWSMFVDWCQKRLAVKDAEYNQKSNSEPLIAKKILSEYGFQMDVSDADEIYQNVYVSGNGKTNSPASMLADPGVCRLVYSENRLKNWLLLFADKQNLQTLKLFTVAHEASHCLFITADYRVYGSTGALTGDLRSLPASYRKNIKFLNELQSVESEKQILIYREALGDVFAIGYLNAISVENWRSATKQLQSHRITESDGIHYTDCWTEYALNRQEYPTRVMDVRSWAIAVVESSGCDTNAEVEKSLALKAKQQP